MVANTTGSENVAVGYYALDANTTASNCTAVGHGALTANTTGSHNTALGQYAGRRSTTAVYGVFIGREAGDEVTTGTSNICIGYNAGGDLTTGSNNVIIGATTQGGGTTREHSIVIGHGIDAGANNQFRFGKASNRVYNEFDQDAAWTRSSDQRLKTNIANATLGLDFVNDLRPVTYKWKASQDLDSSDSQLAKLYHADKNLMNTGITMHGLLAQEVKTALDTAGVNTFGGWSEDEDGVQNISREMFVMPLIKAIQELSTENEALKARLTAGGL
jgi:hypothetical protein